MNKNIIIGAFVIVVLAVGGVVFAQNKFSNFPSNSVSSSLGNISSFSEISSSSQSFLEVSSSSSQISSNVLTISSSAESIKTSSSLNNLTSSSAKTESKTISKVEKFRDSKVPGMSFEVDTNKFKVIKTDKERVLTWNITSRTGVKLDISYPYGSLDYFVGGELACTDSAVSVGNFYRLADRFLLKDDLYAKNSPNYKEFLKIYSEINEMTGEKYEIKQSKQNLYCGDFGSWMTVGTLKGNNLSEFDEIVKTIKY